MTTYIQYCSDCCEGLIEFRNKSGSWTIPLSSYCVTCGKPCDVAHKRIEL